MDNRHQDKNKKHGNNRDNYPRMLTKKFLAFNALLNSLMYIMFKSWGSLLIAVLLYTVIFMWNKPDKFKRTKKTAREFALFHTWVLMRIAMRFYKNKDHPWKKNPISYQDWILGSTVFNDEISYVLTFALIIAVAVISISLTKVFGIL